MMDFSIVYVGNDSSFQETLRASAESLQTGFYGYLLTKKHHKVINFSNLLIFTDDFSTKSVEIIKSISRSSTLSLTIFAGDSDKLVSPDLPAHSQKLFDDVIGKTDNQEWINKRIGFYLNHLQAQSLATNNEEVLDKIDRIKQLSRQINCLDRKKIALVCIEKIPDLISARFASLYTYNEKKGVLNLLHHNHPYTIDKQVDLTQCPDSPMSIAVQKKELLLIKDFFTWSESQDLTITRMFTRNYKSNSCIIAPLKSGDEIFGLLNLADKICDQCFDPIKDLPPIELLCEIIGSAMSNIKLYDKVRTQARTDGMTGLVNHSTFYNELDKEVIRSKRYGNNLSLIMIDLDRLKKANDLLGHRAGDAMIINVTEQIRYCIRETDIAARYGGDEFSVILPNTSLSDALIVAQRLLERVSDNSIEVEGKTLHPSISIGLSQFQTNFTTEEFMREADIALLDAKNSGKNRIHISETVGS